MLDTVLVNEQVKMHADSSVIKSFEPKNYYWDFGDGTIENSYSVEHIYTKVGSYYIKLGIVSDEESEDENEIDFSRRACSQKQIVVIEK